MTKDQEKLISGISGEFVDLLKRTFDDNLRSVILYGSIVRGSFSDRVSDANLLILLSHSDPSGISALGASAARMIRKYRINPLLLTEEEFTSSADVFPMEYLDIRETRNVLYGADTASALDITVSNLRHQVEEQLRGSITALRRALLGARGRNGVIRRYLLQWYGSQNALFRGVLRLKGATEIPQDPAAVASRIAELFAVDPTPFSNWVRLRAGEKLDAQEVARGTLTLLVELSRRVDKLES